MKKTFGLRFARPLLVVAGAALAGGFARGQTPPESLEPYVTSATRTPADQKTIGSAVDSLTSADLALRQINSLAEALGGIPGAPLFASGARGAGASIFLRGANSNQTLFLVDGLRFNDPNTDYNVFLGGACLGACDSLEVAHGPQSTLYGGEAVGGVIALSALRGSGAPSARVAVEAGSFGTAQGVIAAQGEQDSWAYNYSVQGGHTDNSRRNNAFDSVNAVLRLDRVVNARTAVGGTFRWFRGIYGDPGDRFRNDPDNEADESNVLGTAFADLEFSSQLKAHLVAGGQDRHFVSTNPSPSGTQVTDVRNRRAVVDAQVVFTGWDRQRISVGSTAERNHTRNDGFGNIDRRQSLLAFFLQDEISPAENVFFTAGLRSDDFDTFGHATTGRFTAAWLIGQGRLKLRSSYGTAFRSPSFLDLYGQSAFYVGNPNLRPERARGWDAGFDYYLPDRRGTFSLSWFNTDYTDLVVFDFAAFPGTVVNVDRARTRGLEASAAAKVNESTEIRAAYTYLEAENLTAGLRLLRRPRHSLNADVIHRFSATVSAGVGVVHVADREDVNAATFATIDAEDYTVVRVYAAWQASPRLALKVRFENLLGEDYEPVNGYPALGFGAFGSVEWKF